MLRTMETWVAQGPLMTCSRPGTQAVNADREGDPQESPMVLMAAQRAQLKPAQQSRGSGTRVDYAKPRAQ